MTKSHSLRCTRLIHLNLPLLDTHNRRSETCQPGRHENPSRLQDQSTQSVGCKRRPVCEILPFSPKTSFTQAAQLFCLITNLELEGL